MFSYFDPKKSNNFTYRNRFDVVLLEGLDDLRLAFGGDLVLSGVCWRGAATGGDVVSRNLNLDKAS